MCCWLFFCCLNYFFFKFWIRLSCCVCDFFSRTLGEWHASVFVRASKNCRKYQVRICVSVYMCMRVWVFGYHFSFHCAIMRSRGSSLDKNQNIASVDHMCSLLFRAKQKNTLSFVNSYLAKATCEHSLLWLSSMVYTTIYPFGCN